MCTETAVNTQPPARQTHVRETNFYSVLRDSPLESTFPDHPEGGGVGPFSQWEQLEIQNGVERTGRNCVSKSIV